MTPDDYKLESALAAALEWVRTTEGNLCKIIDGVEVRCRSIIEFAAYAKAEMAKRGWMFSVVEKHVRMWGMLGTPHESEITELYEFNPTDPLSESRAIIEACIEALELEA
jgi:hypothetical protein